MQPVSKALDKAIFLDKDGTLIPDIPFNVDATLIRLEDESVEGLRLLSRAGFKLFVVSNQPGVARGLFTVKQLENAWNKIIELLGEHEIKMTGFYYCPHMKDGKVEPYNMDCTCRKPLPGLLHRAAVDHSIDLTRSWMIGDILHDVEAGNRAGCKSILIDNGNETEWITNEFRQPYGIVKNINEAAQLILSQTGRTTRQLSGLSGIRKSL